MSHHLTITIRDYNVPFTVNNDIIDGVIKVHWGAGKYATCPTSTNESQASILKDLMAIYNGGALTPDAKMLECSVDTFWSLYDAYQNLRAVCMYENLKRDNG